ncbi:hypothetical protein DAPPUDRAFT_105311 [Daphnia pulex]|uniref:Peptidase S1 domain-containing protein n=1 Tax=Daphnia pulex TaxID=6669 RepID=E9GQ79_DAPPU|nr:hypothetical protein DAPPUDRAFT_105311 [Daphnia pulex]|eukprot:EFX78393.1 hypothetical protein DAPPUDRAFT_105311 [Daphnia pulex]
MSNCLNSVAHVGYAPSYHGKTLYGQIADPGFVPLPSFNPYPGMAFRQQQQNPNGWSYSFGYPNLISPEDVSPIRQVAPPTTTTTTTTPATTTTTTTPATTTTTTTPAPVIQCGKGPIALPKRSLIAGERVAGVPVLNNAWPFLVTLRKYTDRADFYFCSGTLISDSKVLLAASCLEKLSLYDMSTVTVLIGLTAEAMNAQMTRRISKVVLHGQYNAFTYANDVAVITLDNPVVLSRTAVPVCLAPASTEIDQYADQSAVIIGWGTADNSASSTLTQGTVAISSNVDCKADANFGKYVTGDNICISSEIRFVCAGDIGGPVLVLSSPGIWTQIGINSYTPKGCTANSLQTRVSAFKAWIDTYSAN